MSRLGWLLLPVAVGGGVLWAQQPAVFEVSPSSLSFGSVSPGSTASQTFTIFPVSPGGLSFQIFSNNDAFSASPNSISQTGTQQTVTVTFSPKTTGAFTGQITVTGTSPSTTPSQRTVNVSGTGGASFTVSPTSLSFGSVLLNCASSQQQSFSVTPSS